MLRAIAICLQPPNYKYNMSSTGFQAPVLLPHKETQKEMTGVPVEVTYSRLNAPAALKSID